MVKKASPLSASKKSRKANGKGGDGDVSIVVLRNGVGSNAPFDGQEATIVSRKRAWATVALVNQEGKKIKWRSGAWATKTTTSALPRPIHVREIGNESNAGPRIGLNDLPDGILLHILSYSFAEDDAQDAVRTVVNIAKSFRGLAKRIKTTLVPQISIRAKLGLLHQRMQLQTLIWLSEYRFKLSELQVDVHIADYAILARVIESSFLNVEELQTIGVPYKPFMDLFLFSDIDCFRVVPRARTNDGHELIDVHERVNYDQLLLSYDIHPLQRLVLQVKQRWLSCGLEMLHCALACRCPSLIKISTVLAPRLSPRREVELDVFNLNGNSMPTLRQLNLKISLEFCSQFEGTNIGSSFGKWIASFPNLQHLEIIGVRQNTNSEWMENMEIRSNTLKTIEMRSGKRLFVRKCICPQLEKFVCRGFSYGNGVRPRNPLTGELNTDFPDGNLLDTYLAGEQPFLGMTVPDSCVVVFE